VHVDPIKHTLKAPGAQRLKLKYDKCLQFCFNFVFNFNLRRYVTADPSKLMQVMIDKGDPARQGPAHSCLPPPPWPS